MRTRAQAAILLPQLGLAAFLLQVPSPALPGPFLHAPPWICVGGLCCLCLCLALPDGLGALVGGGRSGLR